MAISAKMCYDMDEKTRAPADCVRKEPPMKQTLIDLRHAMDRQGVDWYMIPTDDFHSSEYVGDYFKCRSFVSGFTGSAGTLLVGREWAGLWTDGRYFLQAASQLEGSGIDLMKIGEENVPRLTAFVEEHLAGGKLGFDGRTVNVKLYEALQKAAEKSGGSVDGGMDLVDGIWKDRPALSAKPAFELDIEYAGRSRADKLADVRRALEESKADVLVLASLMDICWLLNLRGGDVDCTPVMLSFMAVTKDEAVLFVNGSVLSEDIRAHLAADGVSFRAYEDVYAYVKAIAAGQTLQMNLNVVNSAILQSVPEGVKVLDKVDPTNLPKAVKNPVEVANMRLAHIKDGVAVTRLMYWLKKNAGSIPMDEISAAEKLEGFREEQENYIGPSFEPIMAYGPHGAIVHYSATEETNIPVQPSSFLLSDTGGHYLEGSTDITRTFAMGPLTDEEKRMYTAVLKGHLHLGAARFKHGVTGMNLDYLAREPLWMLDMDYNHGTGHGVGYILSVHEGPQSFRWQQTAAKATVLEPGMITSDEPGVYLEGKFGVRLENLIVVAEGNTTPYGRFLHFDYLTMVPWDLDAILPEMLNEDEKRWLNDYHRQVRETLTPRLPADEAAWLAEVTRAV